jgi:hypothetical protein
MPELVVLGFEGIYRATEVPRDLRDLQAERKIDLADAVAVYRSPRCLCLPTRPIRRLLPSCWAATGGAILRTTLPPEEVERLQRLRIGQ